LLFIIAQEIKKELNMFRDKLKELRQKNNMTQEQLAQKLNTTRKSISAYETGRSAPPHETLLMIADIFNVSTDYLLERTAPVDISLNDNREAFRYYLNALVGQNVPDTVLQKLLKLDTIEAEKLPDQLEKIAYDLLEISKKLKSI
jgi:transcriptional regulator with XRE-family HTH domain